MANNLPSHTSSDTLPWGKMLMIALIVFLTGLMSMLQQYGDFFTGNLLGTQQGVLSGYNCPDSDKSFDVSPIPALFSYQKGNMEANRKEMLRLNRKNHGLTSWLTYDMAFNEGLKSSLIDMIAYQTDPNQYLLKMYEAISAHGSVHGALDLVTKWLSPDDINLPTVFPYSNGYVVEATESTGGYGNYVSVCTDVNLGADQQLRVLYTVAHLDTISVQKGQNIQAGSQLGLIGTTGRSTTEHAHIALMTDLLWQPNYRDVYNAGYKSYYPTSIKDVLVKMVDPMSVILNPDIAYSIVSDDVKKQAFFQSPSQYITALTGLASTDISGLIVSDGTADILAVPVFTDFNIILNADSAETGDWVDVTVEAVDQSGNFFPSFEEEIRVVLSSSTAHIDGIGAMKQGRTSFRVTDSQPSEMVLQISNSGSVSEEKKIYFLDRLKYLEVTAPQKTTVGNQVAVSLRPIGTQGGVIGQTLVASVEVFPVIGDQGTLVINKGRGEYLFTPDQEGIYQLSFKTDGVQETIQIVAQELVIPGAAKKNVASDATEVIEVTEATKDDRSMDSVDEGPETVIETAENPAVESPDTSVDSDPVVDENDTSEIFEEKTVQVTADIEILAGSEYVVYEVDKKAFLVFNDANVAEELYPVQINFTVPEGTQSVSIFTGLNDRNFPASGELKLSKYVSGQKSLRYFPKYVPENTYKKIVAYDDKGDQIKDLVFTWSPASMHVFTDVIDGVIDPEIYSAVELLKAAGVVKGNPDGSFGVDSNINRAAVATILIRSFYTDVDLETLKFPGIEFSDVPSGAWYESALWFASQSDYDGFVKPVIIKGFEGRANPDGFVKLEEMLTMILRVLEVDLESSDPWYESALAKSVELGIIKESERSLTDQPISRGLVSRMIVRALELIDEGVIMTNNKKIKTENIDSGNGEDPKEVVVEKEVLLVEPRPAATDIEYTFSDGRLTLTWKSDLEGPYSVYRETVGGNGPILLGSTGGKAFTDISAKIGKQYYYRIDAQGDGVEKAELLIVLN